jgi:hypothetical protein
MPSPTVLTDLLGALDLLLAPQAAGDHPLAALLDEWKKFFKGSIVEPTAQEIAAWRARLATMVAMPDRTGELQLLKEASLHPLLGLTLVAAAIPQIAARQAQSVWSQAFVEEGEHGMPAGWRMKTLAAPGVANGPGGRDTKYLIFSDIHRDDASDDVGDLRTGSIDHFKGNAALYQRILDHAISGGYTVLEAGDCEELWFVRDAAAYPSKTVGTEQVLDVQAKMQAIVDSHPAIYDRLRQLHQAGRYVRIQGNHDSFLKQVGADDSVGQVLKARMDAGAPAGVEPFQIWDCAVIEGIKTMQEHTGLDLLGELGDFAAGQLDAQGLATTLMSGRLGMDANDYTARRRMLVCHGHQFDPWNCPDNEILGLLIANTVGTMADRWMDPLLDARGFALQGNPHYDFGDILAGLPVFDSWPSEQAAVQFAHRIQHMPNAARTFSDNVMYSESVPALWGAFGLALNHRNAQGTLVTPAQSRAALDLRHPAQLMTYLDRHHFHQICIGHTHAPHSQPYWTLDSVSKVVKPLTPVIGLIKALLPMEPRIKSGYFNSGTAGWMEGVVWAIEIGTSGQARLVFWTRNSLGPEFMDWELQALPAALKQQLAQAVAAALQVAINGADQTADAIVAALRQRLEALNMSAEAIAEVLNHAAVLPLQSMALALVSQAGRLPAQAEANRQWVLEEVGAKLRKAGELLDEGAAALGQQLEKLRAFGADILLSVKRRALSGFADPEERESFTVRAPIAPAVQARLTRLKTLFTAMGVAEGPALCHAALALSVFDQFPRNMPFFTTMRGPLDKGTAVLSSPTPVLQALLCSLWSYPVFGTPVEVRGVRMQARFSVSGNMAHLTVEIGTDAPPVLVS